MKTLLVLFCSMVVAAPGAWSQSAYDPSGHAPKGRRVRAPRREHPDRRMGRPRRNLRPRPGYFLEPRRSCSRGFRFLILCRDARRSRRVRGGAVPFARIACGGERASPTATGGCEESVAAQASDVHGLAALDDRAVDEVDGLVAGDGDPGAAGHCVSVAPRGLPPSVAMAVTNSRPKAHKLCDADSRAMAERNPRWGAERLRGELLTEGAGCRLPVILPAAARAC